MLTASKLALGHGPKLLVFRGGEGPPIVWLHGMAVPNADDAVLNAVAAGHEVIAPVTPGVAGLEELTDLPTLHDLLLFYDNVLDQLGIGRAALAGHGFGGMLAAELAALNPARVRRLVLVSPLGLWNDAFPVEDLFARPQPAIEELIWAGASRQPPPAAAEEDEIEARIASINALGAMAKYVWPIPDRGLRGRLYRVAAPTLLLFAKEDAWIPAAYAEEFAAGLAQSRTLLLAGGHMAPYEDPEGFARTIGGFIGDSRG